MSTLMQQQVSCNATGNFVTFIATLSKANLKLKQLGSWVKKHREKMNYSQEVAAEKAGISRYQWIRIENGQSGTKRETILAIAKELKADETEALTLLAGLEPQNAPEDSHEIYEGVTINFQDGKRLSKKKQQELLDAARLVARGVMATGEDE